MTPLPTLPDRKTLPPYRVEVSFGSGIPSDAQGVVMLAMERTLREMGYPAEVFKETMPDDLKRRRDMTPEDRERL